MVCINRHDYAMSSPLMEYADTFLPPPLPVTPSPTPPSFCLLIVHPFKSNYVCLFLVKDTMHTVRNSSLDVIWPHIYMSTGQITIVLRTVHVISNLWKSDEFREILLWIPLNCQVASKMTTCILAQSWGRYPMIPKLPITVVMKSNNCQVANYSCKVGGLATRDHHHRY